MFHEGRQTQSHEPIMPLWMLTITWVPPNMEGHRSSTWILLMSSELPINVLVNARLLSTQLLRPEVGEVEGGASLQKEWKDRRAVYRDCRDFLRQRRENPIHISSRIKDPKVIKGLSPLPQRRPASNPGKERQALEGQEGVGDSGDFQRTRLRKRVW